MLPESEENLPSSVDESNVEAHRDDNNFNDYSIDDLEDYTDEDWDDEDIDDPDDEHAVFEDLVIKPLLSDTHFVPTQSDLSMRVAEKLLELCIKFINQRFSTGYDPHTPLLHFSAVLSIKIQKDSFCDSLTSTPLLAGLIWVSRLLVLEYALPKREYVTLGWPSRGAYEDQATRFEEIRRACLVEGCYCPISELGNLMGYGMHLNKRIPRPGTIEWDDDHLGFQIKNVRSTLEEFEIFIHGLLDKLDTIIKDLFFRTELPKIVLKNIKDRIVEGTPGYSFLSEPENGFKDGHLFLLNSMMNLANQDLRLFDEQGNWKVRKAEEYLALKTSFLKLLMLGNILQTASLIQQLSSSSLDSPRGDQSLVQLNFGTADLALETSSW